MVDLDPSDGFSWIWVSNDLDSGDDSICRGPWLNLEMQKSWQFCLQEYRKLQRLARHMCTLGLWAPSCTLRRGSIFCFACALRCFPSHCQLHIWQLRSTEISKKTPKNIYKNNNKTLGPKPREGRDCQVWKGYLTKTLFEHNNKRESAICSC